jgi:hypothetical protein
MAHRNPTATDREVNMYRNRWLVVGVMLALLGCAGAALAAATTNGDFEVTGPDGRRILLQADGRWRYIDPKAPSAGEGAKSDGAAGVAKAGEEAKAAKSPEKPKIQGEAVLTLERKIDGNRICRLRVKLVNKLPFEIRSLVPEFKVYRSADVVYDSVFGAFQFIRPGDSQTREVRFDGIACPDVVRVQVTGGDRCEMGELDKFSPDKGVCLSLVRVVESDLLPFNK